MQRSKNKACGIESCNAKATRRSNLIGEAEPDTVLVVEDDDSMRAAIDILLSLSGYRTLLFASAEDVLAKNPIEHPLCVISDLNLPAMSGLDLMAELRRRGWPTPVIIITGFDSPSTRQEAMRCGAVAYMAKPFHSAALLTAIHDISPGERAP
jgi:FixJ family two-component response regulator